MDIKELMTDDIGMVSEFESACDDMISCRYILAEGKIIKILQTVALSTVLQNVIGRALKDFDYGATAMSWRNGGFKPLASEKDYVALSMCILSDIDNGKIYLSDFLRQFFWDGSISTAYSAFCGTLIEPFKRYVLAAAGRATSKDFSSIAQKAITLAERIEKLNLSQNEKEEYIFMCDGLASKARTDISAARGYAIALKRLLSDTELSALANDLSDELN